MKVFLFVAIAISVFVTFGFAQAASQQQGVCLKVSGEKVEIHNLANDPIVIDRDGIPDSMPTSMLKSVSAAKESKSYNLLLTGVKRNAEKAMAAFNVKIDEKVYAYPKDSCGE
jgi:hypothetical protein